MYVCMYACMYVCKITYYIWLYRTLLASLFVSDYQYVIIKILIGYLDNDVNLLCSVHHASMTGDGENS